MLKMFNDLGAIPMSNMGNMNSTDQEAHQFITWESFLEKMPLVFGV